jgi:hypothetical protein
MSSVTTRVSLYKPVGIENVNVTTDLDNNWDKIDTNLNYRVVASATARNAISPTWAGLNVRQTDDGTCWVSNGTLPVSASWDQIPTAITYVSALNISAAATGTIVFKQRLGSDANNKFQIRGDGRFDWGAGGGSAVDTNLYRQGADILRTDDALQVGGTLAVTGDITASSGKLNLGASGTIRNQLSGVTTIANTVTETVVAAFTIPANEAVVGSVYKIRVMGRASTTGTPTFVLKTRINGVAGTTMDINGSHTTSSGISNKPFVYDAYVACITTGGSATWDTSSLLSENLTVGTATGTVKLPASSSTITRDSTVSNDLVVTWTWGTANAANTVRVSVVECTRIA